MRSLNDFLLQRRFRLKTEIYEEDSIQTCFEHLQLREDDLILTNSFLLSTLTASGALNDATVVNTDAYGSGEPQEAWVDEILAEANRRAYRRVIAIGGGATIDIGKLCIFGDGRSARELFDDKERLEKKRELIAIPTTCGTGSEVTSVSVVEFGELHSKLGLQIDALFPDRAVLIGELLQTLPAKTFAMTSIDALAHAVESLLSPKANAYTDMFAQTAIRGIVENLKESLVRNGLPSDMRKSLICANMAGIAFSIAGCATMHALSFPLGAGYHLVHGEAVYAVMRSTLAYYRSLQIPLDPLQEVLRPLFADAQDPIEALLRMLESVQPAPSFQAMGIDVQKCEEMAESVYVNQQRLLVNAPIPLQSTDLKNIYCGCLRNKKEKA